MKKYFLIIITILLNFTATAQLAGTLNSAFSQDGYDDTFFEPVCPNVIEHTGYAGAPSGFIDQLAIFEDCFFNFI